MAFASVGTLGTAQDKTAGTTIALTTSATAEVGNLIVVVLACDSGTEASDVELTNLSVTSGTNTFTRITEISGSSGVAAAKSYGAMFYCIVTQQINSGGTITGNVPHSPAASAMTAWEFTKGAGTTISQGATAVNSTPNLSDMPGLTLSGMTSRQYLLLYGVSWEDIAPTTITADADYTAMTKIGTSGGGGPTNITAYGEFRIATLTGDTCDPTVSTVTADLVAMYAALYEVGGVTTHERAAAVTATATTATVPQRYRLRQLAVNATGLTAVSGSKLTIWSRSAAVNATAATAVSGTFETPGAFAPSLLTEGSDTAASTTYTTSSFSPSGGALLVVQVLYQDATADDPGSPTPTTSLSGVTFTSRANVPYDDLATPSARHVVYTAPLGDTPGTGTITFGTFSDALAGCLWKVFEIPTGFNSTTPFPQTAATASDDANASPSSTATLGSALQAATSLRLAFYSKGGSETITPFSGDTAIGSSVVMATPSVNLHASYDVNETTANFSWSGSNRADSVIALEVAAAPAAAVLALNTAEGGTDGVTVTTGNSGGGSGTAWSTVSDIQFEDTSAYVADMGYYSDRTGTSSSYVTWGSSVVGTQSELFFRGYFNFDTLPSSALGFLVFENSGTTLGKLLMGTGGAIHIRDQNDVTQAQTAAVSIDTWYRIECRIKNSGQELDLKLYAGHSGTVIESLTTSAEDYGSANINQIRIGSGVNISDSGSFAIRFDDIAVGTGTWLGPAGTVLPLSNDAEGGSDNTTVTAGNSGGASGDPWDASFLGGTVTFDNERTVDSGSMAYKSSKSTGVLSRVGWNSASIYEAQPEIFYRAYYNFQAYPTVSAQYVLAFYNGSTFLCGISHGTSGILALVDQTGINLDITSIGTVTPDTWWRLEVRLKNSGQEFECRIYPGHSTTATDTLLSTAVDLGGLDVDGLLVGAGLTTANVTYELWFDDVGIANDTWLGPTGVAGAEVERSAAVSATGSISTAGIEVIPRSTAVTATSLIATSGYKIKACTVAVNATGLIATNGLKVQILSRSAAVTATGLIAMDGAPVKSRSTAVTATALIAMDGAPVKSRSVAVTATALIVMDGAPVKSRAVAVTATGSIVTAGQRARLRAVAITATGAIATVGRELLPRAVAVSASAVIASAGFEILPRGVAPTAAASIQVAGQKYSLRQVAVSATTSIVVSGQVQAVGTTTRSAAISATGSIAVAHQRYRLRQVAVTATGAIATAGQKVRVRQVAVNATAAIAVAGEIAGALSRQVAVTATTTTNVTGVVIHVKTAQVSVTAASSITVGFRRELNRQVSVEHLTDLEVTTEFFSILERNGLVSGAGLIQVDYLLGVDLDRAIEIAWFEMELPNVLRVEPMFSEGLRVGRGGPRNRRHVSPWR